MAKQTGYSFTEKKHSGNGIVSSVLGGGSLVVLILLLLIAFWMRGMAAGWIGAVGFTGIAMAVCGLAYGFASFRDDCKYAFFCKFGTILSTVAIVAWFFIVCVGLAN
jgi:hypothetical protein